MRVIIVGAGRLGQEMAAALAIARNEVTLVELTPVRETVHEGLDDRRLLGGQDDSLLPAHERPR